MCGIHLDQELLRIWCLATAHWGVQPSTNNSCLSPLQSQWVFLNAFRSTFGSQWCLFLKHCLNEGITALCLSWHRLPHPKQEHAMDGIHPILEIGKITSYFSGEINCSVTVASVSGKGLFCFVVSRDQSAIFSGIFPPSLLSLSQCLANDDAAPMWAAEKHFEQDWSRAG